MNRMIPIGLAACLAAGCGDNRSERASATANLRAASVITERPVPGSAPPRPVPPWDATACGDDEYRNARMERHPDLTNRTSDDLIAGYGKPHADLRFRAGEGAGTYRGGVASQLPGGAARNARTPVREIVWRRAGCNFIVRFRETNGAWRVFDAFEASADADF